MDVFLSSTCYDLKDLRAELEDFLVKKGYKLLMSDRAQFPVNVDKHRHDTCIENVGRCDLYVLVIDSRFGGKYYNDPEISITWAEFREALRTDRKIIAFVRKDVFNERNTFKQTKKKLIEKLKGYSLDNRQLTEANASEIGSLLQPYGVDNVKTFEFIDEIQLDKRGIWCQPFDDSTDVKDQLDNMYETKHSVFNAPEPPLELSVREIPLTALSGSTASFISGKYEVPESSFISKEVLQSAIKEIPDTVQPWGELLGFEPMPKAFSNLFYFVPLRHTGDEGEMMMGIVPTALGRAVKSELQGVLKKMEDEDAAIVLFTDTVKRKPIFCKACEFNGKSYIIGFYEKRGNIGAVQHLCVLSQFAGKWQILLDHQLDEYESHPSLGENFQLIIYNQKLYFYFERMVQHMGTMFNGIGVAEFSILDFTNKTVNTLLYDGRYRDGGIEGDFNFTLLEKSPDSKLYESMLEHEASKSKFIYRTPVDYNIDAPENFIEKWVIENPDFYRDEMGRVRILEYDINILWDFEGSVDMNSYKAKVSHVETEQYILFYYFAGPVLAYRKDDSKFLVVLVPNGFGAGGTWGIRSINNVEFISDDKIVAKNDYERYEIDLDAGEYNRETIVL